MAKFNVNEADNYGGSAAGYFSLKDDGDSAIVRFMYNQVDDIDGYAVHRIDIGNGRNRYISCLREDYNEPMDNCPLCANRNFQQAKFFFNLFDCETEEVKLWERGKNILKSLIPVLNEINGPICGTPIKVTRHGVAGDQYTKYDFELLESDSCTLKDLPECINPMDPKDGIILSYSIDELDTYVKTGRLPGIETNSSSNNNFNSNINSNNTNNSIRRRYTGGSNRGNTGTNKAF